MAATLDDPKEVDEIINGSKDAPEVKVADLKRGDFVDISMKSVKQKGKRGKATKIFPSNIGFWIIGEGVKADAYGRKSLAVEYRKPFKMVETSLQKVPGHALFPSEWFVRMGDTRWEVLAIRRHSEKAAALHVRFIDGKLFSSYP